MLKHLVYIQDIDQSMALLIWLLQVNNDRSVRVSWSVTSLPRTINNRKPATTGPTIIHRLSSVEIFRKSGSYNRGQHSCIQLHDTFIHIHVGSFTVFCLYLILDSMQFQLLLNIQHIYLEDTVCLGINVKTLHASF